MSDQSPDRPRHRPRRWSRTSLVVAGAATTAAVVSAGLVVAGGGRSADASLSSRVTTPTKVPLASVSAPSSASSPVSRPLVSAQVPARTSASPPSSAPPSSAQAQARASVPPSASAPWVSTSCPNQLLSWRSTGAGGQLQAVVTKLTILSQAATSLSADLASATATTAAITADTTALRSAAASLGSATQAAGKNMIPGCAPSAHQAEVAGLADLDRAVTGFGVAADKTSSGDAGAAQGGIQSAVAAMQSGSAEMATAIVAVNQYGAK